MPPFETPSPPFRSSQLRTWADHVEPQMRNLLWGDYWQRFNTIQIPIYEESDYFNNAIEVAKLAQGKKAEFERIFEKRNAKRREELLSLLADAAYQTIYNDKVFPCKDACDTVSDVCLTGCLWDFLRLLKGNAFGWEADAAEDAQLNGATSNISEETQTSADQLPDPYNKKIYNVYDQTQWPDDDYYDETPMERQSREEQSAKATYYIGTYTYTQCTTAIQSNSIDVLAGEKSVLERKALKTQGKRKRDQCDNDASDARGHHREITSIAPSSIPHTSIEQPTDRSATDDNSALDGVYKRRKVEDPSSQLAADNGTYKKRLRSNDYNDDEQRRKRQKPESPTACITSHVSSSTSLQQLAGENVAAKKSRRTDNGSRGYSSRRKKKASFKPIRSPGPTNTRSVGRIGQATFWELDHSGKPRSIIT
ncbi:hypothetical protein V8C35DRAFT_299434 [Trichoderma chlorosporum]